MSMCDHLLGGVDFGRGKTEKRDSSDFLHQAASFVRACLLVYINL